MKGLNVNVYLFPLGECTGDGVTAKGGSFTLVDESINAPFEVDEGDIYLVLVRRHLFGKDYIHAEPRINGQSVREQGETGPMMGGNFIYSSDSRFRAINEYPIPVHDRFES